jgi:hypothetical protein
VADVGEEEAFGDGDVGGVLAGGGVGGAFVGIPFRVWGLPHVMTIFGDGNQGKVKGIGKIVVTVRIPV